jgi:hypothetical protein
MMSAIKDDNRTVHKAADIKHYCQEQYDRLCAELIRYSNGLQHEEIFYEKLQNLLQKYSIEYDMSSKFVLTSTHRTWLRNLEVQEYRDALSTLQATLKTFPDKSKTKQDADALIKKIEWNRNFDENLLFGLNKNHLIINVKHLI